jgi:hypothetical protein
VVPGGEGMLRKSIGLALGLMMMNLMTMTIAPAFAYDPVPDPHYCRPNRSCSYYAAVNFVEWDQLSARQILLLSEFVSDIGSAQDPRLAFHEWSATHDGLAATFLALTRALEKLTMAMDKGETRPAIDLIVKINRMEGDRIRFRLDADVFEAWKAAGARFTIDLTDGKVETGRFRFGKGNLGGSLHKGYDEQGYSSITKVPRMQINYRHSDSEADIDLDGYAPWIEGWIPNPFHLTFKNSDPRQWYGHYAKKFGDAGFSVVKVKYDPQSN